MNQEIQTMLTACEGRYPTRAEQAILRDWAARLEARLAAVEEIKLAEDPIAGGPVSPVRTARLAEDPIDASVGLGRRLFYDKRLSYNE